MITITLSIVLGVTLLFAVGLVLFLSRYSLTQVPYERADLLSPAEWYFMFILQQALPKRYAVFPQVRLAAIAKMPDHAFLWRYFVKLGAKSVDYTIWDRVNKRTILVIELDDRSHLREDRKARDKYVDQVLKKAGIPIYHQICKAKYTPEEIRDGIIAAIEQTAA